MVDIIEQYVETWERRCYKNGIPDEADQRLESFGLVPSYRRIVNAILKNDPTLKTLGFTPKKGKCYSELKRIEIAARPGVIQLRLF
jgi:predicted phosphoadenosine phosphosulfate sulfurtransferase